MKGKKCDVLEDEKDKTSGLCHAWECWDLHNCLFSLSLKYWALFAYTDIIAVIWRISTGSWSNQTQEKCIKSQLQNRKRTGSDRSICFGNKKRVTNCVSYRALLILRLFILSLPGAGISAKIQTIKPDRKHGLWPWDSSINYELPVFILAPSDFIMANKSNGKDENHHCVSLTILPDFPTLSVAPKPSAEDII